MALTQHLLLRLGQHFRDIRFEFCLSQVAEFNGNQVAVHAHHWRHAHGQVQVGAALCDGELEKGVDSCHKTKAYAQAIGFSSIPAGYGP